MTQEQVAQLERLAIDAAAPLPSILALLSTDDPDIHRAAARELVRTVDDTLAKMADAVIRLQPDGESAAEPPRLDIEDVSIRLRTVVSTLQIMIEANDKTDPDLAAAMAGLRDTVAEQAKRLNEQAA